MTRFLFHFILLVHHGSTLAQTVTMNGFVMEEKSKEILPFVNIVSKNFKEGTASNVYGYYSIEIPMGKEVEVEFSCIGYKTIVKRVNLKYSDRMDIELDPIKIELDEVVILSSQSDVYSNGKIDLPVEWIKQVPSLVGEKDLLKLIQLLPGAQKNAEGSSALYIRGGDPSQNLIILDDALVYNANHLFGFLSVFNGDAIKNVEYWKGGFPARYGGRISSVIDIQMKEGSKEKIKGEGGIGLLSSRVTIQGPIQKEKSSFLVSARRTYFDLLASSFMPKNSKFSYRFHDLNIKLNFDWDARNKIFLSGYFGDDKLKTTDISSGTQSAIDSRIDLGWGNSTATLRWNHLFHEKLFLNTTVLYSNFNFFLSDKFSRTGTQANESFSMFSSAITDYSIKSDLDYFPSNNHTVKTGVLVTYHNYTPRSFLTQNKLTDFNESKAQKYRGLETGLYVEDVWQVTPKMIVNAGVRMSAFTSTTKTYIEPEPRFNFSYDLFSDLKLTTSYARTNQFVHLLSNTGVGLATDLSVPATSKSPPQQADIISVGLTKLFSKNITLSVESYRKYMRNIVAYKEGATFLDIDDGARELIWEDNIAIGKGVSYGTEFLVRKNAGKVTGWVGYTLSWVIHQFDDLNAGKKFFPRYDSRHNISIVSIYQISPRVLLSSTWVFNTGNALNVPRSYYYSNFADGTNFKTNIINGVQYFVPTSVSLGRVPYFGQRNSFRAESYHRLDVAIQFHKKKKKFERFWEFGLFNAYNRKNPFYYYLEATSASGSQQINLKKKSLFPILPSLSYNVKF